MELLVPQKKYPAWRGTLLSVAGVVSVSVLAVTLVKYGAKSDPASPLTTLSGPQGGIAPAALKIGNTIPDFPIQDFKIGSTRFASALTGDKKVVMVNFWATWCEPCTTEMPTIVKLREAYAPQGFEVLAVNVDEDPGEKLTSMILRLKMDFPVYVDPDQKAADIFDVHAIPLTVILDRNRRVLLIETGERDWNGSEFRSQLDHWLAG